MFKRIAFSVMILSLALAACAPATYGLAERQSAESLAYDGATGGAAAQPPAAPMSTAAPPMDADLIAKGGDEAAPVRLVIKNVTLSLVVKEPAESVDSIAALAEGMGGFVVNSNVFQTSTDAAGNKIMQAHISIRVPAAQLTSALSQLKAMAVTVNTENISGEDVTAAYTDLESRLRNLEAAEVQLQKIMDRAVKVDDVLLVYNQLVYTREQIEVVKGQMKYYSEAAAMSLVSIELIPDALSQPIDIGGWKPEGVAKEAIEALIDAAQGLAELAIWGALYCLPLALVFGLPAFFVGRWGWRKLRRPKPQPPAPAKE